MMNKMLPRNLFFVIVHWGNRDLTQKAVLSVINEAGAEREKVILVENGEVSGIDNNLATKILLPRNDGYAAGVNAGIRYALKNGAAYVLVMNNDLLYVNGAAEAMLKKAGEGFDCVGAVVNEGPGQTVFGGGFVGWFRGRTHFVFNRRDVPKMHYVSGAFIMVTRKLLEDVGDMPERYFHTWEDVAWGFRMRRRGWRLGLADTPMIPHLGSQSLSESALKTYYLVRNGAMFIREYAAFYAKAWLLTIEPLRILWARIRGREEVAEALLDARKGVCGKCVSLPMTATGAEYSISAPVAGGGSVYLSIIVVTHQSQDDIVVCLASVKKETASLNSEIIIIDAGSTDETKKVVHQNCADAKYIQLRNVGFAAAANLGAAEAQGKVILFLNPDAVLLEGALKHLGGRFAGNGRLGVVGGFLMSAPQSPERWQKQEFPSLKNILLNHWVKHKSSVFSANDLPVSCGWVSGGALAARADLFRSIGGFNERYFLYFEDVDLCRRIRNSGYEVMLDTQMKVHHKGGASAGEEQRIKEYDRSQGVYFLSHRPYWEYLTLRLVRFVFRRAIEVSLGLFLSGMALFGAVTGLWLPILMLGVALLHLLAAAKWPRVSILLLVASMIAGQSVRVNAGGFYGTVTDLFLPLVLAGLFYRVIINKRIRAFFRMLINGWWIPVAFLPGIILAGQRLPADDFITAISYTIRLLGLLILIPFLRVLRISFSFTRMAVLAVGILLAVLGFLQIMMLPSLPPANPTIFSRLFLSLSGGGWDPHQMRLFSTWLDPNFMGMFFVLCLALLFVAAEKLAAGTDEKKRKTLLPTYWVLELVMFTALVLTRSRASILALGVMLIIFLLLSGVKRLIIPIVTASVFALLLFPSLSARIFVAPFSDPTVQLRLNSWQQGFRHFENFSLFGMGYNAYGVEQLAAGNIINGNINSLAGTDNFTLLIIVTTGVWGVVILGFGMTRFIAGLIRGTCQNQEAAFSVLLILVALFAHSQFIQSFTYVHLLLPVVLLIGSTHRE